MRFVTYEECAAWCLAHGFPINPKDDYGRPEPALRTHFEALSLRYPEDSGNKCLLAKRAISWAAEGGEILLWISDWAVWPTSQHMPLFTRFREALGEHRPLIEAPGQLAMPEEYDDAVSVLTMALQQFWDCDVFAADGRPVFSCSHDEWCAFFVPPDQSVDDLLARFGDFVEAAPTADEG